MLLRWSRGLLIGLLWLALSGPVWADQASDLQAQINARRAEISKLEAEIAAQQKNLAAASGQSKTLQGEVNSLDASLKKLNNDIKLTDQKITESTLTLEQLGLKIKSTEGQVGGHQAELNEALRRWRQRDNQSLPELILAYPSLSAFWREETRSSELQARVLASTDVLKQLSRDLSEEQVAQRAEQQKLTGLKAELKDRQKIANDNRTSRAQLLSETKNKEANYQKLLVAQRAEKAAFEKELTNLESQLHYTLDASQIPKSGSHIFSPPLDDIFVTQPFGDTAFSQAGAYNGSGHNGVDFRASVGTPVRAALSGTVVGVEESQNVTGCGYGRWVLIRHVNGLTTLYGHLSLVKVGKNQAVQAGQIIGYSGQTGYATGPHLHFSLYVSEAVSIKQFTCKSGRTVTLPAAAFSAYLDPLLYL